MPQNAIETSQKEDTFLRFSSAREGHQLIRRLGPVLGPVGGEEAEPTGTGGTDHFAVRTRGGPQLRRTWRSWHQEIPGDQQLHLPGRSFAAVGAPLGVATGHRMARPKDAHSLEAPLWMETSSLERSLASRRVWQAYPSHLSQHSAVFMFSGLSGHLFSEHRRLLLP